MDLRSNKMLCVNCSCTVTNMDIIAAENLPLFLISVFGNILHSNSAVLDNIAICSNCNHYAKTLWNYRNNFLKQTNPASKLGRITERDEIVKKFFGLDEDMKVPKVVNEEFITCDSEVPSQTQEEINSNAQVLNEEIVKREVVKNEPDLYLEKILELKIQKLKLSELRLGKLPKKTNSTIYSCEKCSRKFTIQEKLQNHVQSVHMPAEFDFSCHFCQKSFRYYWFYKNHLKVNHCGVEMTFCCSICRKNVHSQKELDRHNFSAHQITSHPFKCNFCDVAFETVEEMEKLRSHLIEYHGESKEAERAKANVDFIIERQKWIKNKAGKPCKYCGKFIKETLTRTVHILFEHQDHKSCQTCKETFVSEKEFYDHVRSSKHPLTTCALCGKCVSNADFLMNHWENVHNMENRFSFGCEMCSSSFRNYGQLKSHYKYHLDKASPRRFCCNECGKLFTVNNHLKVHIMNVHSLKNNEVMKCKYCEKTFKGKRHRQMIYLNSHITKYHNEELQKETVTFKCIEPGCGLIFLTSQSLHLHKRRHNTDISGSCRLPPEGEQSPNHSGQSSKNLIKSIIKDGVRKLQCGLCEKEMSRLDHLQAHLFYKHNVKFDSVKYDTIDKVKCQVCDKTLKGISTLKKHMAKFHEGNDAPVDKNFKRQYKCTLCDKTCIANKGIRDHIFASHPDTPAAIAADNNNERWKEDLAMGLNSNLNLMQKDVTSKLENFCMWCVNLFSTISDKYAHDIQVHKTLLPCKMCKEEFVSEDSLKEHQQNSHSNLNCHHCSSVFDCVEEYYEHLQTKHTLSPYICEFCGLIFSIKSKLLAHYRVIHGNKQSVTESSKSKQKTNYKQNKLVKCEYCDKSFKGRRVNITLKKHIFKWHNDEYLKNEKTFKCLEPECGLICMSALSLLHHKISHNYNYPDTIAAVKSGHSGQSSKTFIKPLVKDGFRKFQCGLCEIIISKKDYLYTHLFKKHDVKFDHINYNSIYKFKCKVCDKSFQHKYRFESHMNTVHQGTETAPNPNKNLSSRTIKSRNVDESLKKIIKMVNKDNVTKFQCGLCDIIVSRKAHLFRHLFRKHAEKLGKHGSMGKVKCKVCGKISIDKYTLKKHMDSVHQKNHASRVKQLPVRSSTRCRIQKKPIAYNGSDSSSSPSESSDSSFSE